MLLVGGFCVSHCASRSSLCTISHPIVGVVEDGLHSLTGSDDGLPGRQREGELLAKAGGREERANVADAGILGALHTVQF